jgi:hypothetical protein
MADFMTWSASMSRQEGESVKHTARYHVIDQRLIAFKEEGSQKGLPIITVLDELVFKKVDKSPLVSYLLLEHRNHETQNQCCRYMYDNTNYAEEDGSRIESQQGEDKLKESAEVGTINPKSKENSSSEKSNVLTPSSLKNLSNPPG